MREKSLVLIKREPTNEMESGYPEDVERSNATSTSFSLPFCRRRDRHGMKEICKSHEFQDPPEQSYRQQEMEPESTIQRKRPCKTDVVRIELTDLKSFTRFLPDRSEMTAEKFLSQFEREAALMSVSENQLLNIVSFVLREAQLSWCRSNVHSYRTYEDFREEFIRYYRSYCMSYTQSTRLKTIPFNRKVDQSVKKFVIEHYVKINELDPMNSMHISATQLFFCYQRPFASTRALNLNDMLETTCKLDFIHDTNESRRGLPISTTQKQKHVDNYHLGANKIYEVEVSSEEK